MALHLQGAPDQPGLLDVPWSVQLADWPDDVLVGLPRGISRHVVRFVRVGGEVFAVKEIGSWTAHREYGVLRAMDRVRVPSVQALETALITRHLEFSLPYRALFLQTLQPARAVRLLDAVLDPIETGDKAVARYNALWSALTGRQTVRVEERYRVDARIRALNDLDSDRADLAVSEHLWFLSERAMLATADLP